MLRSVVLGVANRSAVRRAVTGGLGRKVALRFVAGEKLSEAIEAVRAINRSGADVSLDHLGEGSTDPSQAEAAAASYLDTLRHISADGLAANVSVKLTQLGLDIDPGACVGFADEIVRTAVQAGTSVTLDMEDHRYTDRTIEQCVRLARAHPDSVGLAIQAYLRRTPEDLERLVAEPVQIRLCKGAYKEPRAIALQTRREVDAAYAALATRLIASDAYAMIATHDEPLIEHSIREIDRIGRAPGTYEFQMLYGVRTELQKSLIERGYKLRVYLPFGSQWYPYLMRRIAERPANMRFFAEALLRH